MADSIIVPDNYVWKNSDKHVSDEIATSNEFVNSAHVLVYASLHGASDGTFSTKFAPIGAVQGWSFTEQRQVEEVFELGSDIRYIVPGRTTGQIAVTRLLVSGKDLVNVFYQTDSVDNYVGSLKEINKPLDIMFVTYNNSVDPTTKEAKAHIMRYFDNCWIVARQESITANQVIIAENCTITYEKIVQFNMTGKSVAAMDSVVSDLLENNA